MAQVLYPSLYQINTRLTLRDLAQVLGRPAKLDDVPDTALDHLVESGFDWIWLLGVWQTGDAARVRASKSYPIDPITGYPIPPGRKLVSNRPTTRVTVTKRSYLDPGTAQRSPLQEHYHDYAFPPDSASSIFYDPTDWRVNFHNRTPFPNCFDLPGFCK